MLNKILFIAAVTCILIACALSILLLIGGHPVPAAQIAGFVLAAASVLFSNRRR